MPARHSVAPGSHQGTRSKGVRNDQEILAAHPDGTVLVVGHGGALQALLCMALGLPPERFWQLQLDNTGIADLRIYPEGAILNLFNDTCHLERAK